MVRSLRVSVCALVFLTCTAFAPFSLPVMNVDLQAIGIGEPSLAPSNRYIVMLKADASDSPEKVSTKHGFKAEKLFSNLRGFAGPLTTKQIDALKKDTSVQSVEPDMIVTAFALPPNLSRVQVLPTGILRSNNTQSPTAKINGTDERVNVDIAIIDTGIQPNHPDLNVFQKVNFTNELTTDDRNGHGTHVAGIAAALDNKIGVVGMAPGARLWSVKVLDRNGSGYMSDIIEGIDYVTSHANEIEVANMSLGCECQTQALNTAISRSVAAGIVYTVAAGNSGKDAATFSPANHPDVIAVSAIADYDGQPGGDSPSTCYRGTDDTLAPYSNFGPVVDIAAPGTCILSTWKGSTYETISGTSMASPHVAGAAALYIATHSKPRTASDVAAVRQALIDAATPQESADGFMGDRDATHEPLLNSKTF